MLAANAWLDWLMYIEDQGWQGRGDELDRRVKARDDSYRRVQLLASEPLRRWFTDTYAPTEYELKRTYVSQLRYGPKIDEKSREGRRLYARLLREDLIQQFRSEVTALRDPLATLSTRLS